MKAILELEGSQVTEEPIEYKSMEMELNLSDPEKPQTSLGVDKFTWTHEPANFLNKWVADGKIFKQPNLKIKLPNGNLIFDGFVDLVEEANFSCEKVETKIREKKSIDWMERVAGGITFDLLYKLGFIKDSDFIKVPYVISDIPDYKEAAILLLYGYVIEIQLKDLITQISKVIADLAGVFTTPAGIVKFIAILAYATLLLISLIKIVKKMFDELMQVTKYHLGMLVVTHFIRACEYLKMGFSSSIFQSNVPSYNELPSGLYSNLLLLPEKYKKGFIRGQNTKQTGHYTSDLRSFIKGFEGHFNGKFFIVNNVGYFERYDYSDANEVYKIQDIKRYFRGYNASEVVSNYLVQYSIDLADKNTIENYNGTNARNQITSKTSDDTHTTLITGENTPPIPFARSTRKNALTRVESFFLSIFKGIDVILKAFYGIVDVAVKAINKSIKIANKFIKAINTIPGVNISTISYKKPPFEKKYLGDLITNRIGMLLLTQDSFTVPKLMMIQGSGWDVRITTDSEVFLSAEKLWNFYHYIESHVPTTNNPTGNQTKIYETVYSSFCQEDYLKVRGLNKDSRGLAKVLSPEGRKARLISLKWKFWDDSATIKYEEKFKYTDDLQQTLIINEGN